MTQAQIRNTLYSARASLFEAIQSNDNENNEYEPLMISKCKDRLLQTKKHIESALLLLKKRSSKRRRSSPKKGQSNVRKADVARSAKRRTE